MENFHAQHRDVLVPCGQRAGVTRETAVQDDDHFLDRLGVVDEFQHLAAPAVGGGQGDITVDRIAVSREVPRGEVGTTGQQCPDTVEQPLPGDGTYDDLDFEVQRVVVVAGQQRL
jgi:hypothetical protein